MVSLVEPRVMLTSSLAPDRPEERFANRFGWKARSFDEHSVLANRQQGDGEFASAFVWTDRR